MKNNDRAIQITKKEERSIQAVWRQIKNDRMLYILLIPVITWYIIFCYLPMGGLSLAFKSFRYDMGIWHSPWVGLKYFKQMFEDEMFWGALKNTLIFAAGKIVFLFPIPILLAVILNELRSNKLKRFFQTVFTFPHFITWVVLSGILINFFSTSGVINGILGIFGESGISPLSTPEMFRPFIWLSALWKEIGWDSIIYLAAFAGIDPGLYEAASIDGASRFQKMIHISWPGIRGTVCIMLILAVGSLMTNGASFDQVFNLYSQPVYSVADTIDTYIYRASFGLGMNFGYTTAISFLKSVINIILITMANKVVTKCGETGLY